MVKRVLYMLVLAITLQLSWSVAAAYCMHESGNASQHFGHHQHEHVADDDADHNGSTLAKKKVGSDPDCASCSAPVIPSKPCGTRMSWGRMSAF